MVIVINRRKQFIIDEYRKEKHSFERLGVVVYEKLSKIAENLGWPLVGIEYRIKTEKSLDGKIERNADSYSQLEDITDILGARIICYFYDEVDAIGKKIEEEFSVDWENSYDIRKSIKADTFGYVSLHYVCTLPEDSDYEEILKEKKFEIQIRTVLQHTWSEINHDLGYKGDFGAPRDIKRQLARIAGLLEIADLEFMRVRDAMQKYTSDIHAKIAENKANNVTIDVISLDEYMTRNKEMRSFLEEIAEISEAEIKNVSTENYISQLKFLGIETLGDLQNMMAQNREVALKLVRQSYENADPGVLTSVIGLRFLCRAELFRRNYSYDKIKDFVMLYIGSEKKAEKQANKIIDRYKALMEE